MENRHERNGYFRSRNQPFDERIYLLLRQIVNAISAQPFVQGVAGWRVGDREKFIVPINLREVARQHFLIAIELFPPLLRLTLLASSFPGIRIDILFGDYRTQHDDLHRHSRDIQSSGDYRLARAGLGSHEVGQTGKASAYRQQQQAGQTPVEKEFQKLLHMITTRNVFVALVTDHTSGSLNQVIDANDCSPPIDTTGAKTLIANSIDIFFTVTILSTSILP